MQGWQVAAYWQAAWQARRFKIQVWLRGDTHLRNDGAGPVQRIKRVALRRLLNRVDRFLCVGEANRQFYLSQKIPAERMTSAPHCVDNARFAAEVARLRPQRQKIRSYWHIDDRAFCLLFVGKFTPGKRPLDLIMAVREFQKANIDRALHILFVGTGELERELRQSCVIASDVDGCSGGGGNGNPTASFAGFLNQTQISQAYVAADCLVLPSASETWGLVVNEAMASGLPCVTSDACGCVEDLILPISPELVYPAGDIARLQQSLKAVMAHPPSRSLLEAHIDGYNPLRTVMMVEQLYLQAIAHQPVCC
jgi:glycosyltransferase involved in cell wall biosynthesis